MLKIEVLGPGCPKCQTLEKNVRTALQEMGLAAEVTKVTNVNEIAARGVFMTPGVVVDGKVVSSGHLLSVNQVKKILEGRTGGENG
jgi:small redox-active disulfide protein 2